MANTIPLNVTIGTLPPASEGETRQQYANSIAQRLIVELPSDNSTFKIGGAQPTSDEGPWFKEVTDPKSGNSSYELWIWSKDAATYKPFTLTQSQLRYFVGTAAPDHNVYDLWFQVFTSGAPTTLYTYNSNNGAWEALCYRISQIDNFFEGESAGGKKQVDWANVLNIPVYVGNAPRSSDKSGDNLTPAYDYERVFHTELGTDLVYSPEKGGWITTGGNTGDVKFVKAANLGTVGDFNAGTFNTALGRNPGWTQDVDSEGRAIVGAKPSEVWDSTTTTTKSAGSTYGADQFTLTELQMPAHTHHVAADVDVDDTALTGSNQIARADTSGSNDQEYDLRGDGTAATLGETSSTGGGQATSNVQKSIAYWALVKQ